MNIFHGYIGMLHDDALLIQYLIGKGNNAFVTDQFAHNFEILRIKIRFAAENQASLAQRNPTSLNAWSGGKLKRYATRK